MNALLTEGLLDLFDRIFVRFRPEIDDAVTWLKNTATPPENLQFAASDGALYTGLVVLERSKAILVLAVRTGQVAPHPPLINPSRQSPACQNPPYQASAYQPRYDPQTRIRDRYDDDGDPGDGWNPNDPFLPRR